MYNEHDLRPIKVSQAQGDELVQGSIRRRMAWLDATRDYRETASEVRQLYMENRPSGQEFIDAEASMDARSRVRMPVMAQSVDSTLAQQHLATYPTDERFFKAQPQNELSKDKQLLYEDSVEKRMTLLNFMRKSKMDRMNMMLDGASVVWHPYCRKTRSRPVYNRRTLFGIPFGKPRKTYQEQVYLEATDFIPLNLEDWWVDPTVDNFDECNFIWRQWVHPDTLKEIEEYQNTADVSPYTNTADDSLTRRDENYRLMGFEVSLTEAEERLAEGHAMLFEEWGDFYVDGELYENALLVYSNDCHFHGLFENPFDHGYKPFSIDAYIPLPGTLLGKSMGRDIIPLAHAYDAFLNGAIDIINSSSGPVWTYLTTDTALAEMFSEGKKTVAPGEVFPVQSHDSLRQIVTSLQNLGEISVFMQRSKEEIRESTGGVPYATGGISDLDTDRTATEVNTLASGTSTRYQDRIQDYENFKLKRYLWMWFENDRQLMTEPIFIDGEALDPELVQQMDFEFEVIGSKTAMSQSREAAAYMGLINMLPNLLQTGQFAIKGDQVEIDLVGILHQLLRSQGARNADDHVKVVATQEEMEQQQPSLLEEVIANGQAQQGGAALDLGAVPGEPGMGPTLPPA